MNVPDLHSRYSLYGAPFAGPFDPNDFSVPEGN
jgi:hypothetical protein